MPETKKPHGNSGRKMSDETKAKISAAMKGNHNGSGNKGRKHSEATKAKISAASKATRTAQENQPKDSE